MNNLETEEVYREKYLKYKAKYIALTKNMDGGDITVSELLTYIIEKIKSEEPLPSGFFDRCGDIDSKKLVDKGGTFGFGKKKRNLETNLFDKSHMKGDMYTLHNTLKEHIITKVTELYKENTIPPRTKLFFEEIKNIYKISTLLTSHNKNYNILHDLKIEYNPSK